MSDWTFKDSMMLQLDAMAAEYLRGLFTSLLGVETEVALLRQRHAHLDTAAIAERIVSDAITRSGQIGAAAGLPTLLPVFGGAFVAGTIAADTTFLLREQLSMLLQLVFLYEPKRERDEREMRALELYARFAAPDEVPTTPTPALLGHAARTAFKHVARRVLRSVWRKRVSAWIAVPASLIISAKVNRDATLEIGSFAITELRPR